MHTHVILVHVFDLYAHGAGGAVQQAVHVLHNAKPTHQVVSL